MDNKKAIALLSMIEFEHAECCLNTWYKGIDNDMKEALEMAIEALEQTRWIPYDDDDDATWPEDGTWNIFTNGKQLSVERFKVDALNHFYPNGRWFELDDAIAWMPLPQPYKGESEG